jgi:hypothetical protein
MYAVQHRQGVHKNPMQCIVANSFLVFFFTKYIHFCSFAKMCFSMLKGSLKRDFLLQVFFILSFAPDPWVYHGCNFRFYQNSQRYPKVEVNHRCQQHQQKMTKFLYRKVFPFFGDTIAVYTHMMTFYLMFTLRCRQTVFVASISLPVLLTLAINYCRCCWYRR